MVDREKARRAIRGLYVITDEGLVPGRSHRAIAEAAVAGGARVVQLRDKRRSPEDLAAVARELLTVTRPAGALLIINDRADVAAAVGADGVHLGVGDLSHEEARALVGPAGLVGFSPETDEQAVAAGTAGVDYLGVGAIYGSSTKHDAGLPVGPERIRRLKELTEVRIVAIGGITAETIPEVLGAGASAVAVISAVVAALDPAAETRRLCSIIERCGAARQ